MWVLTKTKIKQVVKINTDWDIVNKCSWRRWIWDDMKRWTTLTQLPHTDTFYFKENSSIFWRFSKLHLVCWNEQMIRQGLCDTFLIVWLSHHVMSQYMGLNSDIWWFEHCITAASLKTKVNSTLARLFSVWNVNRIDMNELV